MYVYIFGVINPFIANNGGPPKRVINILKGFYSSHLKSRNFDSKYYWLIRSLNIRFISKLFLENKLDH